MTFAEGAVYTNDKGRFRIVRKTMSTGTWEGVVSDHVFRSRAGTYRPVSDGRGRYCGLHSFVAWAVREATPEEAAAVQLALAGRL